MFYLRRSQLLRSDPQASVAVALARKPNLAHPIRERTGWGAETDAGVHLEDFMTTATTLGRTSLRQCIR